MKANLFILYNLILQKKSNIEEKNLDSFPQQTPKKKPLQEINLNFAAPLPRRLNTFENISPSYPKCSKLDKRSYTWNNTCSVDSFTTSVSHKHQSLSVDNVRREFILYTSFT